MNNRVIAAIILVVVVAGGAFWLTRNNKTDVAGESQTTDEAKVEAGVETASIKSLIESGKTRKCTYETEQDGFKTSGVMYSANNKMRGDISVDMNKEGMKTLTHMVYDGGTSYVWSDDSDMGFKMSLDQSAQVETQNKSVDLDKDYNFKCENWSADNSKFELPSNVKFTDMGTFTGTDVNAAANAAASASGSLDTKEAQTAVCNSLPAAAKDACLKAMQ